MSCTPWSNEKERADYYENLYKEQFAELDDLKRDTVPKLQSALERANKYGVELERLTSALDKSTKEFLKLHDDYQLQKAEIKRLQTVKKHIQNLILRGCDYSDAEAYNNAFKKALEQLYDNVNIKTEAIKEFAERLEHDFKRNKDDGYGYVAYLCDIRNLVKEMTGENI